MSRKSNKKSRKGLKIFLILVIIASIAVLAAYVYKMYFSGEEIFLGSDTVNEAKEPIVVEQKKPQIFQGNDRPIAVMLDNNKSAWPHAGINKAYMVYEIIVEGGESRLMAMFKGQDLSKIGPIRSSRHYFLDYALENDAIYVHFGWSPQAQSDISSLRVNNLNGISQSSTDFWRVKDKKAPHNAVTSTQKILEMANKKKYRVTSDVSSVLNYTVDEVNLEDGEIAENVSIPYSSSNVVRWEYNSETKRYLRYSKGVKQTEWDTNEDVTAKNIIIEFIANSVLNDGENKDRQTMTTTGTKNGYYITNGKAVKITCTKNTRNGKTKYSTLDGQEIEVNDGNTFVQICPINAKVTLN